MAHDYKDTGSKAKPAPKAAKPARRKPAAKPKAPSSKPQPVASVKSSGSPMASMVIGLLMGMVIMGGMVYLYLLISSESDAPAVVVVPQQPKAVEAPSEPKAESGSRFDFYSILPKLEVIIPEQEVVERSASGSNTKIKPIEKPGRYVLQAGSFRTAADADRVRAELALLGVQAHIETVTINNSDTWHRVRIGPFDNNKQLDKTRNRLLDNSIEVMVLKVKS